MKILITGPESSGKSTLARSLAWCLDGIYVAEQAREYLHAQGDNYTATDLPKIWAAQLAAEWLADDKGASFVICDTGPEVIKIWSEVKYGWVDSTVLDAVDNHLYDLTFLCQPDLPWLNDALRETPDHAAREQLFNIYQELLPHAVIIGGADRIERAILAVVERPGKDSLA